MRVGAMPPLSLCAGEGGSGGEGVRGETMKIAKTTVFVLGDPPPPGPVDERIEALAFLRIETDEGIGGLSEIFAVPPGVARAVLDGPDSFFGRLLRDRGYRAVKVEPMESAPETIVELARLARAELGPDRLLCVDVGYLWNDVGTALRVAERLAEHDVFFLETPFPVDALDAYRRLSAGTRLRIAAGEHTVTRWEFLDLMDWGGVTVAQPYMTTVGGLSEAKRVVDLAQPRGVLVCPGNWSTGVLGAATVHLAAYSPITPIFEFVAPEAYWSPLRRAIAEVSLPVVDGAIQLPTAAGIGVDLPDDLVAHFRVG